MSIKADLPSGTNIEVFKNLRDGDVVWVSVPPGAEVDTDSLHTSISSGIEADVVVFVMPSNLVERIKVLDLADLISLRTVIDKAIEGVVATRSDEEDVS